MSVRGVVVRVIAAIGRGRLNAGELSAMMRSGRSRLGERDDRNKRQKRGGK